MVIIRYVFGIFFLISLISPKVSAQEKRGGISSIARSGEHEILLRWAPQDPMTWKLGNRHGYTIERFTIGKNGQVDSTGNWERVYIASQPIKPWPLDGWEALAQRDTYGAIAAQAIYGETFELSSPSGDVVTFINQVKEEKNRFGFALFAADHSADVAQASGLRWKDSNVKKGEEYLYRIILANNPGNFPVDTALVTAKAIQPAPLPQPQEVNAKFGDRTATISWNGFYFSHIYVSYNVEKSEDGKTFYPVNNLPIVHGEQPDGESQQVFLIDSLAQNNKKYYYRIYGVTPFSEKGPASEVVAGMGVVSLADVYPTIDTVSLADNQATTIQWSFPAAMASHVAGYQVVRSGSLNGIYQPIHQNLLSSQTTSFTDQAPLSTNYYRVKAMGPDSTFTGSVPYMIALEDSIPPALPEQFTGKVNQDGKVNIHWKASISPDVLGYRIYRANDPEEEFVLISSATIQDTTYTDSILIATLTEKVYYRIVALDQRFNVSDYSEVLSLTRPDIIPPVPAQINAISILNYGVQLQWFASPSTDLLEYVLLRTDATSSGYQTLKRFDIGDSLYTYVDTLVQPNTTYRYILRTLDDDGLNAAYPSTVVTTLDAAQSGEIKNLATTVDREHRQIKLQWINVSDKTITGYRIFRATGEEPLRHYQHNNTKDTVFIDRKLLISKNYRYAVQAIYEDGSESKLSMETIIKY